MGGMDYDEMPAGREMDALVAERVYGKGLCDEEDWSVVTAPGGLRVLGTRCPVHGLNNCQQKILLPSYSTDIAAAWGVVEKMGTPFELDSVSQDNHLARFGGHGFWVAGSTAPLAICRAALEAVGA